MDKLKRYGPLVGTFVVATSVILHAFGYGAAADSVDFVGGVTGLSGQSGVSATEFVAAGAAVAGVCMKVLALFNKARSGK